MQPSSAGGFVHLHVHSHYTLLGGTASATELAERAAADTCLLDDLAFVERLADVGGQEPQHAGLTRGK